MLTSQHNLTKLSANRERLNSDSHQEMNGSSHGKLKYNFSAGPCILPRAVLDQCSYNVIDYNGTGQSVMELSHRGAEFA